MKVSEEAFKKVQTRSSSELCYLMLFSIPAILNPRRWLLQRYCLMNSCRFSNQSFPSIVYAKKKLCIACTLPLHSFMDRINLMWSALAGLINFFGLCKISNLPCYDYYRDPSLFVLPSLPVSPLGQWLPSIHPNSYVGLHNPSSTYCLPLPLHKNKILYTPLAEIDPEVQNVIDKETWRQFSGLELIASEAHYPLVDPFQTSLTKSILRTSLVGQPWKLMVPS